jgi:hypothetical protein
MLPVVGSRSCVRVSIAGQGMRQIAVNLHFRPEAIRGHLATAHAGASN